MQIPEGWEIKNISQISNLKKGVQFNKLDLDKEGLYPCINGGVEPSGFSSKWNTEKNTITISEGGNSCGYVNYINKSFWLGGHCYALLELKNSIVKEFLYQALKGVQDDIMDLRVGSGLPNIQQKAIKIFEVKIPKSTTEQKKIAEILSKVDTAIEQTQSLITKYQRIKTGLMQDLLTKGIDENGNIRSEETHEFKDSELGRIPKEWDCLPLIKCMELHNNLRKPISAIEREKIVGTYPYYGATGIIDRINKYTVDGEFVLFGEDGDHFLKWNYQEQTIFVKGKFNVSNHAHIVKGNEKCSTEWIHHFFMHRDITFYLTRQGAGRFKLNKESISALPILVPKNPKEIDIISSKINAITRIIHDYMDKKDKIQSLKTALMQDLLSGKKRVNSLITDGEL